MAFNVDADGNDVVRGPAPPPVRANAAPPKRFRVTAEGEDSEDSHDVPDTMAPRPFPSGPKAEDPELTWLQTGVGFGKSIAPSTGRVVVDIAKAVASPVQTGKAIGALGRGAVSKASGALGVAQDAKQKIDDEAVVNALMDHYKQTYGSMKGFKNALATDPANVLMDLSAVFTGGLGTAAKMAGKTSAVGRALDIASSAARFADPIQTPLRIAGAGVAPPLRWLSAGATGVPMKLQKKAFEAGASGDPVLRAAFTDFASGRGTAEDLFAATQTAVSSLAQKASDAFMTTKAGLSAKAPEWKPIDDAIVAARKDYNIGGVRHSVAFKKEHEMLDEIEKIVNDLKSNPAAQNIAEFDKMKRAIYQVGADGGNVTGTGPAMKVYGAVKDSIIKESPEYAKLMEQWQGHLVEMNNLRAGVGSNRTAASTALAKMLKSAKTSGKGNLIDRIGEVDKSIPYMLAGAASSPLMRQGLLGEVSRYGGALAVLAAPTLIPHIAGAALGTSPRLAGAVNYGLGRISPLGKYVTPSLYAGSMADRANAEAKQPIINSSESPMASRAYAEAQPDAIWKRLLIAESGGRQFDKSNKPITSPKGAVGIAQVMPGTGPEAAKLAGLPWDENRFRTDAKYNEAIGRAYYDKQARDFGSPAAALAAYNAGPTAVRQAQQRASAAGSSDFLSYLPKETQDYVRKILGPQAKAAYGGRIQRASGGRAGMNHAAMAERLCAMAARSKNALGRATKPLLQTSDDAIATALAVANRTI